jgi:dimethylhistidine N-methyltransferase
MTSSSGSVPTTAGDDDLADLADAVRAGLLSSSSSSGGGHKWLPPRLFYDDEGSRLFEAITELPEYYLTRTERGLLQAHADDIVGLAKGDAQALQLVELGAGTATKTQILLEAVVRLQGSCVFMPIDVSGGALDVARARLAREAPAVLVRPVVGRHDEAAAAVAALGPRRLVCFIGSSLGNFDDDENISLLRLVAGSLTPGDCLLLGADRKKDPARVLPAYDDAAGVTARFNKNMLVRLNRELGADFNVDAFAHRAVWNEGDSRVEMHLVSTMAQQVRFGAIDAVASFAVGESIHTESSVKYDDVRIDHIVRAAGLVREQTFIDDDGLFGLHLRGLVVAV